MKLKPDVMDQQLAQGMDIAKTTESIHSNVLATIRGWAYIVKHVTFVVLIYAIKEGIAHITKQWKYVHVSLAL